MKRKPDETSEFAYKKLFVIKEHPYIAFELGNTACGNKQHPDGPWHRAAPIPASWQWLEQIKQWWRRRNYGCGCPRSGRTHIENIKEIDNGTR